MSERPWPLYHVSELGSLPEPKWLVDRHVTDGLTVVYGPPKAGKTFLTLAWSLCIGSGHRWHGHRVEQAPVVYVSGEGQGGLHKRVQGWQHAEGVGHSQVYVVAAGARLLKREHVIALRDDVHATGARLLVVDTLARSMAGGDENSQQDMGMVVQGLDWVRAQTKCGVIVVHHSGKASDGPRGSTALFGAADTLIRVDGDGSRVDVSCEGQKDAPPFAREHFALVQAGPSVSLSPRAVQIPSGHSVI